MEEVVREFVHRQFLRPVMLHELWDIAGRAHAAMEARAPGAERWAVWEGRRGTCSARGLLPRCVATQ
jgi:hypothetical protein